MEKCPLKKGQPYCGDWCPVFGNPTKSAEDLLECLDKCAKILKEEGDNGNQD